MIDRRLPDVAGAPATGLAVLDYAPDPARGRIVDLPDGGVEIHYASTEVGPTEAAHEANLAEHLPKQTLQSLASDLAAAVDDDLTSRKDWETALAQGLELLGIRVEDRTIPWAGACGVVHPMILEAAVRFQSKSITKLFPPEGPANAKVVGEATHERLQQAMRVKDDLNHWLCDRMPEYRDETEQMLFALP